MTSASTRILWIDAARAFAVLAVLLMHYQAYVGGPANPAPEGLERIWPWIVTQLGPVRMPLLLFMSGLLASSRLLSTNKAAAAARGISSFYLNAVWTTIYFIAGLFLTAPGPGQIDSVADWARQLVTPGSNLWFVWALGFWAIAFIFLRPLPPVLVLALFVAAGIFGDLARSSLPSRLVPVLIYGTFFALGVYGKKYMLDFLRSHVVAKAIVLGTIYALVHRVAQVDGTDRVLRSLLIDLRSMLAIMLFASVFVLLVRWAPLGRFLAIIGQRTLPLFVCHLPLLWTVINIAPLREMLTLPHLELAWPLLGLAYLAGGSLAIHWIARKIGARHLFDVPQVLLPRSARKK